MLPLNLVLDLAKFWAENQTVKKLKAYAADPRPDIQFDMPIVGAKVDIWVRDVDKPPTMAPKAKKGLKGSNRTIVGLKSNFWRDDGM